MPVLISLLPEGAGAGGTASPDGGGGADGPLQPGQRQDAELGLLTDAQVEERLRRLPLSLWNKLYRRGAGLSQPGRGRAAGGSVRTDRRWGR